MNCFLNLNKPLGLTAHDCIARLRKILHHKRIGHAGTLDPMAGGVLPIAVNRYTRLLPFLQGDKSYHAVVQFGTVTDTDDITGQPYHHQPCPHLTLPQVAEHLPKFIGTIVQRPPAYSAIQIGGKRLYDLARSHSLAPEQIPLRTVTIYQIRILAWQEGAFPHLTLEIECGSGTYIRSIARDLGEMLGCGATLFALTRTASNGFLLENSSSLEDIAHAYQPIPADTVLAHHDRLEIGGADLYRWRQGQALTISGAWHTPYLATYSQDGESRGELVGISIHQGDHVFPKVVL